MAEQQEGEPSGWDGGPCGRSSSSTASSSGDNNGNLVRPSFKMFDRTKPRNGPSNVTLENVDVIDLDGLDMDEEDAWLYKLRETPKDSPSPYAWVRQEFECPGLCSHSKSLLNVLEQASKRKVSRHLEYPDPEKNSLSSKSSESTSVCLDNRFFDKKDDILDHSEKAENPTDGVIGDSFSPNTNDLVLNADGNSQTMPASRSKYEIDTRTFTRPKKNKAGNKIKIDPIRLDPEFEGPLPSSVPIKNVDQGLDESLTVKKIEAVQHPLTEYKRQESFLKVEDLTDVQVLARMQEENLRSSCSSPLSYTPKTQRRGLSESTSRLCQSSLSCSSDVSSPNFSHDDPGRVVKSTNSLSSTGSDSPTSRSESLTNVIPTQGKSLREFGNVHPRSLPNLMKASKFGLPRSLPSDSKLCTSAGQKSLPSSTPDIMKGNDNSAPERSSSLAEAKVAVTASPSVDLDQTSVKLKIPTVVKSSSGIPKPSFASKLKQPMKWKKNLTTPAQNDGSWKEGCF